MRRGLLIETSCSPKDFFIFPFNILSKKEMQGSEKYLSPNCKELFINQVYLRVTLQWAS
jgi:hypothetical protein